jgi:hypothetical protein
MSCSCAILDDKLGEEGRGAGMNKEEEDDDNDDDDDEDGVEDDAEIEDVIVLLATGVLEAKIEDVIVSLATGVLEEARAALIADASLDGFCCGVDIIVVVCNNSFAAAFSSPSFWLPRVLLLDLRGVASECATSRLDNTLLLRLSLTPMLILLMLLEEASLFS